MNSADFDADLNDKLWGMNSLSDCNQAASA